MSDEEVMQWLDEGDVHFSERALFERHRHFGEADLVEALRRLAVTRKALSMTEDLFPSAICGCPVCSSEAYDHIRRRMVHDASCIFATMPRPE